MRIKAKTSPTGYIATVRGSLDFEYEHPVIRFDEAGHALISNTEGLLVRASIQPGFVSVRPLGVR